MIRSLYRVYLYAVFVALLSFAAVTLGMLLQTLLNFTPLRDSYVSIPDRATLLQSVTLAVVSWVIAGALGGLHYWLIRHDMNNDSTAGTGAVRSFFLNIAEGWAIVVGVTVVGFSIINVWAQNGGGFTSQFATAFSAFLVAFVLELERRRTQTGIGLALRFRRIHLYGVQFILLLSLIYAWLTDMKPLLDGLLLGSQGLHNACTAANGYCPPYNFFGLFVTLLWFTTCWLAYGWLTRNDASPRLGLIVYFVSFAIGIGFIVSGLYQGVTLLLYPLFHLTMTGTDGTTPFSLLMLGLLIVGVYHFLLRRSARLGLLPLKTMLALENTIAAALFAASFWWGMGTLLFHTLQALAPMQNRPAATDWIMAIAFIVAGVVCIPLDLLLYRRTLNNPSETASARRAFALALLGAGILAATIGAAMALYAWMTALLGSPVSSWQQIVQMGLAAFLIGAVLIGIYLPAVLRGHLFAGVTKMPTSTPSVSASPPLAPATLVQEEPLLLETLDAILDALLAGKITRDDAAERIRVLMNASAHSK